jgi:hypothetical protein
MSSRFAPDGEVVTVVTGGDPDPTDLPLGQRLSIEEATTGRQLLTIPRDLSYYPVDFSPDGKLLTAGIHSFPNRGFQVQSVSLMEVATGEEVLRVEGPINLLAFSPDGRRLATNDAVGAGGIRVWDVATGQLLFQRRWPDGLVHHPGWSPAHCLAFLPNGRALATGMEDGTVFVWDLAPQTCPETGLARDLGRKELDALWTDLAAEARKAHRAIWTLAAAPAQAVPFLADHLRPVAGVDAKRVEKLLADLDSERFAVREAAARELTEMGQQIEPALRRVLESKPPLEVRNRVETILAAQRGVPPAALLRTLRAIQALERSGTPEARQVLRKLAEGAAGARETREAKASLQRLAKRPIPNP